MTDAIVHYMLEDAVAAFRAHQAEYCNKCFQGIFCETKYKLQIQVVRAEQRLRQKGLYEVGGGYGRV